MAETAVKADALEELADGLGLPREAFLAQVERYILPSRYPKVVQGPPRLMPGTW